MFFFKKSEHFLKYLYGMHVGEIRLKIYSSLYILEISYCSNYMFKSIEILR